MCEIYFMNVRTTNKSLEVILRTCSGVGALGCAVGAALGGVFIYSLAKENFE